MLSGGSQRCTCKDCLNERAETFTYGCREAVTVAAAVATATTVIDDLRKNGVQWLRTHCTSAGLFVAKKSNCAAASAVDGGQTDRQDGKAGNVACIWCDADFDSLFF